MSEDNSKNYYDHLHETARIYQTELWAIPAVFFALQGLILQALDFKLLASFQNAIILALNVIFSSLLWLIFEKHHVWALLLQGKMTEFDNIVKYFSKPTAEEPGKKIEIIPMYSMKEQNFKDQIAKWELQDKDNKMDYRLRFVVKRTVSKYVSNFMILTILSSATLSVITWVKLLR